ncbi:hypothetical protein THMIRHAM_01730 [Thiomicrorhabdus immobilis]|uniref:Lipoprotein n=1 Tax=Thiomicrorhabdus immobilis TaxID=2791037 RepID=A0ABM7MAN4_9GAMM|nr:hypothetical protein [Thiomicrorhabdus immobilis]BCN92388.1 hypothetical protein THMIRHAM_01730 [Thiomicrorhabdus immobilis]
MLKTLSIILLGTAVLASTGCVTRQSVQVSSHHNVGPNTKVSLYFSTADRMRIKQYYTYNYRKPHPHGMPPGQQKRQYRHFHRHQALPHNISYSRLPYELERHLPPLPRDYVRIRIGEDIAIMNTRTRIIYDVMWFLE